MAYSGKDFEQDVKSSWHEQKPECSLIRLYDNVGGFKNISGVSDYIVGAECGTILLECKTTKEASFPFNNFSQREGMLQMCQTAYTHGGVLVYFRKQQVLVWYTIESIERMILFHGKKSVNPDNFLLEGFFVKFERKRTHIRVDFEDLLEVIAGGIEFEKAVTSSD